jgi:hypothetical protein
MATGSVALHLLLFSLTIWLGLYLIGRNPAGSRLLFAAGGLLAFAAAVAVELLAAYAPEAAALAAWSRPFFLSLLLFWPATIVFLLPEGAALRARFSARPYGAVIVGTTLLFGLGLGLLLLEVTWLPRSWLLLALGTDLILLGLAAAILDAAEEGQALLPDLFRAFDFSFFAVLLFGGLVGLTIYFSTGVTLPMLLLLLATITAAVGFEIFSDPLARFFDRVALARFPRLRQARAELRTAAGALPRLDEGLDLAQLDEEEFIRLTRRALSHLGDLPRLAASPLTRLPLISARLAGREAHDDTLARTAELKMLLTESIARLKPEPDEAFGATDAWRHYNALYFPYVAGLKPYSRRASHNGLNPAQREALRWFQSDVPERTLHNWQNTAARLIAQQLRQKMT